MEVGFSFLFHFPLPLVGQFAQGLMNAYPEKDGQLVPKWKPTVKGGLKVSRGPLERRYISRAFPDGCENIQALSVSPFTTTPFLPISVVSLRLFRTWC